ncbi:hypothetical protein GHT06_001517 [Daphnia sinensis]|uniref:Uncharacterized protein n=1 Tax=Daphnia sinensis TaxID=1820382 RepID=A0AAD5KFP8_9CRUS|nr:hypothetical protein GHT06_001517 [Daphnia sinensis]
MHSIIRHLETKHSLRLEKFWKCSKCGIIEQGKKMHAHDVKCMPSASTHQETPRISGDSSTSLSTPLALQSDVAAPEHSSPLQAPPTQSLLREDHDADDAPNESWLFILSRHDATNASRAEVTETTINSDTSSPCINTTAATESSLAERSPQITSIIPPLADEVQDQNTPPTDGSQAVTCEKLFGLQLTKGQT